MEDNTKEFKIESAFLFQDDRKERITDLSNVYTSNHFFHQVFGENMNKSGSYLKKKKVIKITSHDTGASVYRIWNGAPRGVKNKDTVFLDVNAKYDLIDDKNKDTVKLTLSKGSKFSFFWNHFDHDIRLTFKLAVWSVIIGGISFIIGVASLIIGIISILR